MNNSQSEELESITYKIILSGKSSVGKTCLFKKLTTGKYSEKNISTIGIDRRSFPLKVKVEENGEEIEKNFLIQLWDTAGQERFRSITKGYYKDSHGLLLMYDITNRESFDDLYKWITGVKESLGEEDNINENKYIIILMGNKLDLANDGARKVETSDAEKLCQDNDIIWGGECSAKDFTIEELNEKFQEYTKELFKRIGYSIARNTITANSDSKNKKEKSKCC